MSTGALSWMITIMVIGVAMFVGLEATGAMADAMVEQEPIEMTEPVPVFDWVPLAMVCGIGLMIWFVTSAIQGPNSTGKRADTPWKAIEREKKRYAEGEISLEKFEDRVYQMIPIEEEQ